MSDVKGGPDWWLGEDDKWYPPVKMASAKFPEADFPAGNSEDGSKEPSKKQVVRGLIAIVVIVLGVLLVKQFTKTEYAEVNGSFSLTDNYTIYGWSTDENCNTSGGYSDIGSATPVVVTNSGGKELARTSLGSYPIVGSGRGRVCTWNFSLSIPKGEKYYIISIGERGEIQKTFEELTQDGIHVGIDENN